MSIEGNLNRVFDLGAVAAAHLLQSMEIVDPTTGEKIRMEELQSFDKVGGRYINGIKDIPKGHLWSPYRRTTQTLITLSEPLACVRIVRSSYYDLAEGKYIFVDAEGSTAEHLKMPRGGIAKMDYQPELGVFHLLKIKGINSSDSDTPVSPESVERDFDKFFLP